MRERRLATARVGPQGGKSHGGTLGRALRTLGASLDLGGLGVLHGTEGRTGFSRFFHAAGKEEEKEKKKKEIEVQEGPLEGFGGHETVCKTVGLSQGVPERQSRPGRPVHNVVICVRKVCPPSFKRRCTHANSRHSFYAYYRPEAGRPRRRIYSGRDGLPQFSSTRPGGTLRAAAPVGLGLSRASRCGL